MRLWCTFLSEPEVKNTFSTLRTVHGLTLPAVDACQLTSLRTVHGLTLPGVDACQLTSLFKFT